MAGINKFIAGEEAVAGDIYWSMGDCLSFDLKLTNRRGGYQTEPTVVTDYDSDIGIDPKIGIGDSVKFIELDRSSGLWTIAGTELSLAKIQAAIKRVKYYRILSCSKDGSHPTNESWLLELATQTRRRVLLNGLTINPAPVSDLRRFSNLILNWLSEDQQRLFALNDASFECLIMTLIDRMGYYVKPVGSTHQKDGGIDIVAWPEGGLPHLVAIQAKHHGVRGKTSASDVRNFLGAIEANPIFSFGLLVTNTDFTADAKDFADKVQTKVRLRSGSDINRWLTNDCLHESDWLPEEINIALGVTTKLTVAPKSRDPVYDARFARQVIDYYLPSGDCRGKPFGKTFNPD